MTVQIVLLLAVAIVLLRPWWLVTHRRCGLCRSFTSRRRDRCRLCGAHGALTAPAMTSADGDLRDFGSVDVPAIEA